MIPESFIGFTRFDVSKTLGSNSKPVLTRLFIWESTGVEDNGFPKLSFKYDKLAVLFDCISSDSDSRVTRSKSILFSLFYENSTSSRLFSFVF